ncbi:hypothetical protein PanWU01x14_201700 [Parasponia andersonii]|uniref:F-box associated domain-containing protein n=1 Tax=Parasponia andersonii TaxID=3476 RepID=A0A2P5BXD9_PARAD|nr:hypothetical protein PanWU01x14_201700 [Parasponia andersonii]
MDATINAQSHSVGIEHRRSEGVTAKRGGGGEAYSGDDGKRHTISVSSYTGCNGLLVVGRLFISTPISRRSCDVIFHGRRFELYRAKTKTWTTLGTGFSDYFGFEDGYCEYKPVEFGGYLCVFSGYENACRLDMWAMMEYGESTTWAMLFSVVPSSYYSTLKPLTYNYKTSDEVRLFVDHKRFILYDLKANTEKEVSISGPPDGPKEKHYFTIINSCIRSFGEALKNEF